MKTEKLRQNTGKPMTTASDTIEEANFKLRAVACPTWSQTRAATLARVARSLGLTPSQARRIIYREGKRVDAHVLDNIRAAYARLEARAEQAADLQLARAQAAQAGFHAADTQLTDEYHSTDRSGTLPRG